VIIELHGSAAENSHLMGRFDDRERIILRLGTSLGTSVALDHQNAIEHAAIEQASTGAAKAT
jgi:hypothetical protein